MSPAKTCTRCELALPVTDFYRDRLTGRLRSDCKKCRCAQVREWKSKNLDSARAANREWTAANPTQVWAAKLAAYGITPDIYNDMMERQGGVCAICGSGPGKNRLHVDHDHETGKVRGLLCSACNPGLGMFKDDVIRLRAAIDYLTK